MAPLSCRGSPGGSVEFRIEIRRGRQGTGLFVPPSTFGEALGIISWSIGVFPRHGVSLGACVGYRCRVAYGPRFGHPEGWLWAR